MRTTNNREVSLIQAATIGNTINSAIRKSMELVSDKCSAFHLTRGQQNQYVVECLFDGKLDFCRKSCPQSREFLERPS